VILALLKGEINHTCLTGFQVLHFRQLRFLVMSQIIYDNGGISKMLRTTVSISRAEGGMVKAPSITATMEIRR
jgi:hypothetical protein